MTFNYKTISVSRPMELNIERIRAHQECIIRTANLRSDGTLIHDEVIDGSLIELIPDTVYEERLLIGEISSKNFYYDETRDRYLGLDTLTIDFYLDGSNRKNMYLYNIPGISSSSVPFRIFEEYCLVAVEGYTTTPVSAGTDLMEVRDINNNSITLLTLSNNTGSDATEYYNDTMDLIINPNSKLGCYVLNFGVSIPVLKLYLKKTFYPV